MTSLPQSAIPGGWCEQAIVLNGRSFTLALPRDPDEFLNQLPATWKDGDEPLDPYWAKLWPAAQHLAEAVLRANLPPGQLVHEIGCGIGLVGLAALAAGQAVVFSDLVTDAVELALHNARRNGFAVGGIANLGQGESPQLPHQPGHATGLVFDWRSNLELPRFPLVVASDVLYYASEHQALLEVIRRSLAPGGQCWIGDPGRYAAQTFVELARTAGFSVTVRNAQGRELSSPLFGEYQLIALRR